VRGSTKTQPELSLGSTALQEDQRTVRSTLNAISGGLSFRTGSIHPDASVSTTQNHSQHLLLRWKAVSPVGCLFEEPLVNELFQNAYAFLPTDLEQARRLIDRWGEATHLHELASNAIGDIGTCRSFALRRRDRKRFEVNVRQ
jgi:hypothetical protein